MYITEQNIFQFLLAGHFSIILLVCCIGLIIFYAISAILFEVLNIEVLNNFYDNYIKNFEIFKFFGINVFIMIIIIGILTLCSIFAINNDIRKMEFPSNTLKIEVDDIDINNIPKKLIIKNKMRTINYNKSDLYYYADDIEQPYYTILEEKVSFNINELSFITKEILAAQGENSLIKYTIKEIHY